LAKLKWLDYRSLFHETYGKNTQRILARLAREIKPPDIIVAPAKNMRFIRPVGITLVSIILVHLANSFNCLSSPCWASE
jgi:hypothetical protein